MQDDRPRRGKGRKRRDSQRSQGTDSGFFTNDGFEAELDAVRRFDDTAENTALNNMDPIHEAQLFERFEQDYRSGGYDPGTNIGMEQPRDRFGPDPRDISGYRPLANRTDSGYHLAPEEPSANGYPPADDRRADHRPGGHRADSRRPDDRWPDDSRADDRGADRRADDRHGGHRADDRRSDRRAKDRHGDRRADDRRDDRRADDRRGDRRADRGERRRHGKSRPPEGGARIPMFARRTGPAPAQRPRESSASPFGELTGYVVPIAVAVVVVMVLVVLLLNR